MREIELSLNQTQKIRLKRALEKLESSSSKANSNSNASVSISDSIPVNHEDGVLKYLSLSLSLSLRFTLNFHSMYICMYAFAIYVAIFIFLLNFLRGHGTLDLNGELVATLCGVVERVNKLVYVRALRAR